MAIILKTERIIRENFDWIPEDAINYINSICNPQSLESKRIFNLEKGTLNRVNLDNENFILEQYYATKLEKDCFYESHFQYVDIQICLGGEEYIKVIDNKDLIIESEDIVKDLLKYRFSKKGSLFQLSKNYSAIFESSDAHMGCIQTEANQEIFKTVLKIKKSKAKND